MSARKATFLAMLPLAAAFLLAPLAVLTGKVTGHPALFQTYGPEGMALWTGLAGLALLVSLTSSGLESSRQGRSAKPSMALGLVLAVALALLVRRYAPLIGQAQDYAPLLEELRLPALVLFCGLWAWQFGATSRSTIASLGAALGALMTLDFLLTAIMARSLVLGGGFLLGSASGGGQDVLAFLLCLALCATLDKTDADAPVRGEADAPSHLARWLILAGLFASFSRPALGAAAGIILLLDSAPLRERLALACSFVLAVWISMVLPLPHFMGSGREELSLAWYFSATLEALGQTTQAPFLGLPLGDPLALAITEDLPGLDWDPESMGLPVYIFEIPSSGLRLLAAWGAGGPIVLLAGVLLCALRGRSRFGFGLVLLTLVCGALTPVLHTPSTAIGLCLTLLAAARGLPSAGGAARQGQGDA